ncbi:VAMP-like protein YKT61 [Iris pallida]|uniref:VAMP-like protein YKT61 n=1 Tax=Iris pallida TaxID=29817 RepID=A0AAX6F8V4_IRIPA|nr:VAMP-like protein YKT61 [Iris pallida]
MSQLEKSHMGCNSHQHQVDEYTNCASYWRIRLYEQRTTNFPGGFN